jgi:hypothetical protein
MRCGPSTNISKKKANWTKPPKIDEFYIDDKEWWGADVSYRSAHRKLWRQCVANIEARRNNKPSQRGTSAGTKIITFKTHPAK